MRDYICASGSVDRDHLEGKRPGLIGVIFRKAQQDPGLGQAARETIAEDQEIERVFTATEALQYGLIDRVEG